MTAAAKDKLRRLVDIAKEAARLELEGERLIEELAPAAPPVMSRPVQRRLAAQRCEPAPTFDPPPAADPRQLLVPGAEPPPPGTTLADRIAGMLQATPSGISINALVQTLGVKPKSVRATLTVLKSRGRATTISRGVWGP